MRACLLRELLSAVFICGCSASEFLRSDGSERYARQRCLGAACFLTVVTEHRLQSCATSLSCSVECLERAAVRTGPWELHASTPLFLRAKPGVRSKPFTAMTGLWSGAGWAASSSHPIWPGAELSLTVRAKLPSQLRAPSSHVPVNPPIPGGAPNCCSSEATPSLLRWAYCPKGTPTHTTCPWEPLLVLEFCAE